MALAAIALLGAAAGLSRTSGVAPSTKASSGAGLMPREQRLTRGRPFHGNLRDLPYVRPVRRERPEREPPPVIPIHYPSAGSSPPAASKPSIARPATAAPAPATSFNGLDFENWGDGHPPDTNGDVGPTYYIQTVNTSVGIFDKGTGALVTAFTFDTLMSQGAFGNLCDTDNFGDPYVLYDSFEDRWIVTDFAFKVDSFGNIANPPGSFQCFAVSMSGDPIGGGWNFYSINTAGGTGDYPKFGIWPDGLYMSANMFDYPATGPFLNVRAYAFNKAQMYAGAASPQVVSFDLPAAEFTVLPANARLQAGTPPAGRPNLYAVVWNFTNAESVYKFHVDWNAISTSTLTGPDISIAPADWADPPNTVPSLGGNNLDTLAVRTMAQNQYTNLGGAESLWTSHTVQGSSASQAAVRFYQVNVTGGTVAANTTQAFTHNPDGSMNRFLPSVAVDRAGNMVIGYSTSNSSTKPAIQYAGRLAGDPVNSLPQTEQLLRQGLGTQTGSCSGTCTRWGDYSAAALDPDGCTLWLTNEYYDKDGLSWLTRIGAFQYPSCTPVGSGGTIQGTVTATSGGAPIAGATVSFGSRTATANGSGFYSFANIPAGTYPGISASATGFVTSASSIVVVTDGGTTTRDFSLASAPQSGCLTDTTQADFLGGVPSSVDLTSSPGDVKLGTVPAIDQQNTTVSNTGNAITTSVWEAQTLTPSVSGLLTRIDVDLFCSSCSEAGPAITVELRTTSAGLPTSTVLASTTIPAFSSGAGTFYSARFGSPAAVSAGTVYAFVLRLLADRATGGYFALRSNNNQYGGGAQIISTNSGGSWSAQNKDLGFKAFVATLAPSGEFVSSLKDANPSAGNAANWTTISWNASVPAGTDVKFQAAARNDLLGVFNFVGPDGTPATFFSSGGSLSQFNGFRYLKYKATLTTGNPSSPIVNDVTVCFTDSAATPTPTRTPTRTPTNTPTNTPPPTLTPTPQVTPIALSVDSAANGVFSDG
ncbi:MAG TPA: carboxypeptidase-like regulatory domain-containing protein, partial [Thermoanaerobaculia bacterium]|nr:carboxypeptidase-like regulatory domain-containing protein [Thermoanaerobaculia bacterium]